MHGDISFQGPALKKLLSKPERKFLPQGTAPKGVVDAKHGVQPTRASRYLANQGSLCGRHDEQEGPQRNRRLRQVHHPRRDSGRVG